ncbi:MAG: hypothetical protein QXU72_02340 [Thermofilum sp.]
MERLASGEGMRELREAGEKGGILPGASSLEDAYCAADQATERRTPSL